MGMRVGVLWIKHFEGKRGVMNFEIENLLKWLI